MPLFKSNKISAAEETVAEQLQNKRAEKDLTLKEIATKLNISYKYLKALEKGDYAKLPTGIYAKNFLREYALFLGLDYSQLANLFDQEKNIYLQPKQKELFAKQKVKKRQFLAVPKILKIFIIIAITIAFFIYLGIGIKQIISPPSLIVYNPINDFTTTKKNINVIGQTEPEALILINGEQVLSDSEGKFQQTINLKAGINNITITASKKYGRDNTIIRQILVKND